MVPLINSQACLVESTSSTAKMSLRKHRGNNLAIRRYKLMFHLRGVLKIKAWLLSSLRDITKNDNVDQESFIVKKSSNVGRSMKDIEIFTAVIFTYNCVRNFPTY